MLRYSSLFLDPPTHHLPRFPIDGMMELIEVDLHNEDEKGGPLPANNYRGTVIGWTNGQVENESGVGRIHN